MQVQLLRLHQDHSVSTYLLKFQLEKLTNEPTVYLIGAEWDFLARARVTRTVSSIICSCATGCAFSSVPDGTESISITFGSVAVEALEVSARGGGGVALCVLKEQVKPELHDLEM